MGILPKIRGSVISSVYRRVGLQNKWRNETRLGLVSGSLERTILTGPSSTNFCKEKYSSLVLPMMESWSKETSFMDKLVDFTKHSPTPISIEQFLIMGKIGAIKEKDSFLFLLAEMSTRYVLKFI